MVKRFLQLVSLLLLLLLLSGAAPDNYYARAERLLAGLNALILQANVLPVVTGALDEARKNSHSNYYQNIIVLADAKENRAWRAYENSRKPTGEYTRTDRRRQRDNFFADYYAAGTRGADRYLDNILIAPDQYLEQFFVLEMPDLPDPRGAGFKLPLLKVLPLDERVSGRESGNLQWRIKAVPVYGLKRRVNDTTIVPEYNFGVALQIISPEGVTIKNKAQLGSLTPFAAITPVPENAAQYLDFQQTTASGTITLAFTGHLQAAPGKPALINYILTENIQVVEFSASDTLGLPVYLKKESLPDPRNPLPFVWLPDKQPGEYYLELRGYDLQNEISQAEPKLLDLTSARKQDYISVPNNPSGEYYGVLDFSALPSGQGRSKIHFRLYGAEDSSGRPVTATLYVDFADTPGGTK